MIGTPEGHVVIYDCAALAESELALKVIQPYWDKPAWIPKSLIHDDSECYKDDTEGTLVIPEWFAEKEGLV